MLDTRQGRRANAYLAGGGSNAHAPPLLKQEVPQGLWAQTLSDHSVPLLKKVLQ